MCTGVDLSPFIPYYTTVLHHLIMTPSEKNLKKIIIDMKKSGTPEITYIKLKSQIKSKKKSLL